MFLLTTSCFLILSLCFLKLVPQQGILKKIFHPLGIFIICFAMLHFFIPCLQTIYQIGRFSYFGKDETYLLLSMLICFSYLLTVMIVFYVSGTPSIDYSKISIAANTLTPIKIEKFTVSFLQLLTFLGVISIAFIVYQYKDNFSYLLSNRINLLSGYGYLYKLQIFSIPLTILLACRRFSAGNSIISWKIIFLFLLVFISGISIGSRAQALIMLPFLFLTFFYSKSENLNTKEFRKVILILFAAFLISFSLGKLRQEIQMGNYSLNYEDLKEIDKAHATSNALHEAYISFGHTELLAFLLDNGERFNFAKGCTYLAGLISFVPRAFWSTKPMGGGPMLANIVAPGSYDLSQQDRNSSLTTGVVIEAYLNLGILGVLLIAIFHGKLISWLAKYTSRLKSSIDFAMYLILLYFISILLVNGEFLGSFSSIAFILFPIWFIRRVRVRI